MPDSEIKQKNDVATLTDSVQAKQPFAAEPAEKGLGGFFHFRSKDGKDSSKKSLAWSAKSAYPLTIFIIVLILCWFMAFLYANVYETIALGQNVTSLKALVISQNLNEADFNKIIELTKNKNAGASWRADNINNAFIFAPRIKTGASAAASSTASSSPVSAAASGSSTATTTKK